MIWIVGEYGEIIENSEQLIETFMENFKDEPSYVQSQILTSTVKIFL
jgi:AP-1 complex subunit beta-1